MSEPHTNVFQHHPLSFLNQHQEKEDQQKEKRFSSAQCSTGSDCPQPQTYDYQVATTSTDKALCRKKHTDSIQSFSHSPCSLCPSQCSPHSSERQGTSMASTQPSVILDREHCDTDAAERGKAINKRFFVFVALFYKWVKKNSTSVPNKRFWFNTADVFIEPTTSAWR